MSFREAVEQDLGNAAWQPGLQALRAQDRTKIAPENTHRLKGSVDLDTQLLQRKRTVVAVWKQGRPAGKLGG